LSPVRVKAGRSVAGAERVGGGLGTGREQRPGRGGGFRTRRGGFSLYKTGGAGPRWVACRAVSLRDRVGPTDRPRRARAWWWCAVGREADWFTEGFDLAFPFLPRFGNVRDATPRHLHDDVPAGGVDSFTSPRTSRHGLDPARYVGCYRLTLLGVCKYNLRFVLCTHLHKLYLVTS
jgi:hypothetical protein